MENQNIYKKAKAYGVPVVRTESHKLLKKIVKEHQPKHILEIGTAVGYSGISILEECDGDLVTIEHNKDYIKQAKRNFKSNNIHKRVKIINGDCMVELAKMINSKQFDCYFDFIFLDGPKAQYNAMLDSLIILLKPNGVLLVDNVLFRGYISGDKKAPTRRYKTIIKRLNIFIENCKNHHLLTDFNLFLIDDGLIFAKKVKDEK